MDDLVRWLGAQLDADAARATAACGQGEGRWHHESSHPNGYVYDGDQPVVYDESAPLPEEAEHIAEWDPARVLREIGAKRRILARHATDPNEAHDRLWRNACKGCGTMGDCDDPVTEDINDCPELRDLATVYADRPGYLESWRP